MYYNTDIIPADIKESVCGIVFQVIVLEILAFIVGWFSLVFIERPYDLFRKSVISKIK